jgi:cell division transport system permease protein
MIFDLKSTMGARRKSAASASLLSDWRRWLNREVIEAGLRHHAFSLVSSLRRLGWRPINSLLTIGVIGIALALPAGLFVAVKNLGEISGGWESLGDVALYLVPDATGEVARELGETLSKRENLASVQIVSPDQGRAEMDQVAGFGEALEVLQQNPLPWVLVLRPRQIEGTDLAAFAQEMEALPEVDAALFDFQWLERFRQLLRIGRWSVVVVGMLLSLAVVLIVGNTVRLDIENRRREIEVIQLLGATNGFIRRPFLYGGFWFGLLGGSLAVIVVAVATAILGAPVAALADAYNSPFRLDPLSATESVQLVIIGATIGWLGSWLAVSRQLAQEQPE